MDIILRRLFILWCLFNQFAILIPNANTQSNIITTYEANYNLPGGKTSQRQFLEGFVTDANSQFQINAGNCQVKFTGQPEKLIFSVPEVGAVPALTQYQQVFTCYVTDATSFETTIGKFKADPDVILNNINRRLLQWGDVAAVLISATALAVSFQALSVANAAYTKADDDLTATSLMQGSIDQLNAYDTANTAAVIASQQQITYLTKASSITNQNIAQLNDNQNRTDQALSLITAQMVKDNLVQQNNLITVKNALQAQITGGTNATLQAIIQLTQRLADSVTLQQSINADLYANLRYDLDKIGGLSVRIQDLIRNTQANRVGSQQLHILLAKLKSTYKAILKDFGFAPIGLVGPDLIQAVEFNYLNFVGPTNGVLYTIHSMLFKFFVDSGYALAHMNDLPPDVNTILKMFGSPSCHRMYSNPFDPPSNSTCVIWVEVQDTTCQGSTNNGTKFDWQTSPLVLPNDTTTLHTSYCNAGGFSQGTNLVFKDVVSFLNFLTQFPTNYPIDPTLNYYFFAVRSGKEGFINIPVSTFGLTTSAMTQAVVTGGYSQQSLLLWLFSSFNSGFASSMQDIKIKEIKLYGTIPTGGIHTAQQSMTQLPIWANLNSSDPAEYAAAQLLQCTTLSYVAQSVAVQKVYALELLSVTDDITVNVQCPPCTDPTVCYPVGTTDISQNIQSFDSMPNIAPTGTIVIGDLATAAQTGIVDAADNLLGVGNSYFERKNKYTCYLMPPGTTETIGLDAFTALYGQVYDPIDCALSLGPVTFNAVFDADGYPQCNVPGGTLTTSVNPNITLDEHGCLAPFLFQSNITAPFPLTSSSKQLPSYCTFNSALEIFQSVANVATYTGGSISATAHFNTNNTFTVWFQSSIALTSNSISGAISVLLSAFATNYMHFIVDANGKVAVLINTPSNVASTTGLVLDTRNLDVTNNRALITRNLRDGINHQIAFRTLIYASSPTNPTLSFEIFIDGVTQGVWSNVATNGIIPASVAVSSAIYYNALSLFPNSITDPNTGNSDLDSIILAIRYNTILNNTNIKDIYGCQQAWQSDRCTKPNQEQLVIARQNVTNTGGITCLATAYLLTSTNAMDLLYPNAVGLANNIAGTAGPVTLFPLSSFWTLAFWVRIPYVAINTDLIEYYQGSTTLRVFFDNTIGQFVLKLVINNVLTVPVNVYDGNAHYVSIIYSNVANPASVSVYLDGVIIFTGTATPRSPTLSATPFVDASDYITMIKYYPGVALQPTSIVGEMNCQYDKSNLPSSAWVPAIGFCELTGDGIHAYCSQPLLCAGHCSAYSTYDSSTGTFAPGALECYNGFAAPDCLTTCIRTDASGLCLPDVQTTATGLIPNGKWCNLLKQYQCSMNHATKIMTCYKRHWHYVFQSIIPNGLVSQDISAGGCPSSQWAAYTDGTASLVLSNPLVTPIYVVVVFAPELYYNGSIPCTLPCCNLQGISATVSTGVVNVDIPQCGPMQVTIYRNNNPPLLNDLTQCGLPMSADSIAASIEFASTKVPLGISTAMTVVSNTIAVAMADSLSSMAQRLDDLLIFATASGASSTQILSALQTDKANLAAFKFANNNITINLVDDSILQVNISNLIAQNTASYQQVADNVLSVNFILNQTANLTQVVAKFILAMQAATNASEELNALAELVTANGLSVTAGGNAFLNTIGGVVKNVADGAAKAAVAAEGFVGSLFGGPGIGGLGGAILNFLLPFIFIAIIIGIIWLIYTAYRDKKWCFAPKPVTVKTIEPAKLVSETRGLLNRHPASYTVDSQYNNNNNYAKPVPQASVKWRIDEENPSD